MYKILIKPHYVNEEFAKCYISYLQNKNKYIARKRDIYKFNKML